MRIANFILPAAVVVALAALPAPQDSGTPFVVATLPTVGALVREIAGDTVQVIDLARGDEDPHFVAPTPLLMRRARDAEALFEVGMKLELWVDRVVEGAGNPRIGRGSPGRVILSAGIPPLEVPTRIDAAQGDIHPQGNPHLWLDPVRAKKMAATAEAALARLFPDHAAMYAERLKSFQDRVDRALYGEELLKLVGAKTLDRHVLAGTLHEFLQKPFRGEPLAAKAGGWLAKTAPLRGLHVIEYHKVWVYFSRTFGFDIAGVIEEYPGVKPGPGHIERTIDLVRRQSIPVILVDNFYDRALPDHIAGKGGASVVVLPNQVKGDKGIDDYFGLIDHVIDRILEGLAARPGGAEQKVVR